MAKELYVLDNEAKERFFTFKNTAVSLLAGNAVLYAGNPEQWVLDTQLLSELLHNEALRFAEGEKDATEQEGSQDSQSDEEVTTGESV
jgi:hypothetical protein